MNYWGWRCGAIPIYVTPKGLKFRISCYVKDDNSKTATSIGSEADLFLFSLLFIEKC